MSSKLVIGTANFGLRYGIANDKKLSPEEAFAILDYAHSQGVEWIDTARAYGDAENVVGEFFEKRGKVLKVISKLPGKEYITAQDVGREVSDSLKNMNVPFIDVFLIHSFGTWKRYGNIIVPVLQSLCRDKIIGNYGVSVYHPEEIVEITRETGDELVFEFPLNLFDQRFLIDGFMEDLNSRGFSFFARSVFLQGLFFLQYGALNGRFVQVKDRLRKIRDLSAEHQIRPECLALSFATARPWIGGVVIGVDSVEQVKSNVECLRSWNSDKYSAVEHALSELATDNEDIILPYRWNT